MNLPAKPSAPWSGLGARSAVARLQALLERAAAAVPEAADGELRRERAVERKVVGLTLEGELRAAAARVGGSLSLFAEPARLCARVLALAGETPRAASLLLDAGLPADAADAATASGELDVLARSLEALHGPAERAARAQAAFHRYESALVTGLVGDALLALRDAAEARPDNAAYADLLRALEARRPADGALVLVHGEETRVLARAPAWIGRGTEAAVRVAFPGVSRRHAEVRVQDGLCTLRDAAGHVAWQSGVEGPHRAGEDVLVGRLLVHVAARGHAAWLALGDAAMQAWVVAPGQPFSLDASGPADVRLDWPDQGFPRLSSAGTPLAVNGRAVGPRGVDLALGDDVTWGGVTWRAQDPGT